MRLTIVGKDNSTLCPDVSFRSDRPGPEKQLVLQFLETLNIQVPKGCNVTVFREPRIETAYPDIVIVVWHAATALKWNPYRAALTKNDFRVMHHLVNTGCSDCEKLQEVFALKVADSLARLHAADMIRPHGKHWVAKPLSKCYATRHIVAMEAKICEWQVALDQAYVNTWFASTSYIIVPRISRNSNLVKRAEALGLGVHEMTASVFDTRQLPSERLPISYASWLFNEWACRMAQHNIAESSSANGYQLGSKVSVGYLPPSAASPIRG